MQPLADASVANSVPIPSSQISPFDPDSRAVSNSGATEPFTPSPRNSHGKTPAQVLIKWSLQLGNSVITRSRSPEHLAANLEVFDFELTDDQMAALNGLDDGTRYRPDPETYTG